MHRPLARAIAAFCAALALLACAAAPLAALDRGPPAQRSGPLAITGEGSTGPVSGMCVKVSGQAVCRALADWWNDRANVLAYGVDPTGASDSTAALRRALATGRKTVYLPAGTTVRVKGNLVQNSGQRISGDGVMTSRIVVDAGFDLTAPAVVSVSAGDATLQRDGAGIDGVGFVFEQPAAANSRATLTHFPPALDISNTFRYRIGVLRISAAWDGIKCAGNCGGLVWDTVEVGAFNRGILLDGAADFGHINTVHGWLFGIEGNAGWESVYYDRNTVCAEIGRFDGLDIKSLNCFASAVVGNANGTTGAARQISQLQLDGDGARFRNFAGDWQIGMVSSTKGDTRTPVIPAFWQDAPGGTVLVGSMRLWGGQFSAYATVTQGTLVVSGGSFEQVYDYPALHVIGGVGIVNNVRLKPPAGASRSQPFLLQASGGCLVAKSNTATETGTGNLIFVQGDNPCTTVQGNDFNGWGYAVDPGSRLGEYGPNKVAPFTWTPTPSFDGGNGTFTVSGYGVRQGFYSYGAGRIDYAFRVYFTHPAFSGVSGNFVLTGLPFNAAQIDPMPGTLGEFGGFRLSSGYSSAVPAIRATGAGQGIYLLQQGGVPAFLPASGVPAAAGTRYLSGAGSIPLR